MTTQTHPRAEMVAQILERYGTHAGADEHGIQWAQRQAANGLRMGLHESEAILAAMNELDLWVELAARYCENLVGSDRFVRDSGMEAV